MTDFNPALEPFEIVVPLSSDDLDLSEADLVAMCAAAVQDLEASGATDVQDLETSVRHLGLHVRAVVLRGKAVKP